MKYVKSYLDACGTVFMILGAGYLGFASIFSPTPLTDYFCFLSIICGLGGVAKTFFK